MTRPTYLSAHFSYFEGVNTSHRQYDNTPPDAVYNNMLIAAQGMEKVREILGNKPISISSWYRSPQVNKAVKGSKNSAHMTGFAVDFVCPSYGAPLDVAKAIAHSGMNFDQVIHEFGRWVHISFDPRMRGQLLTFKPGASAPVIGLV